MAGATITTLSNVLKEYYLPPTVEQLNNDVLLLQRLNASDKEIFGKGVFFPVHYGRNTGVGARGESIALAAAGNQAYDRATFDLAYLYGRIRVTGPSMIKSSTEAGAFLQALKSEMDGVRNDLTKDLARQLYGTGDGVIATVGTGTASATQTVTSDEALRKAQIFPGMLVDVGTAANPVATLDSTSGANPVLSVSIANKTVTFTSSITTTTSDKIVRQGSNKANGTYETNGIQQIIPTAANTFGGIDATASGKAYWDVQRVNMNGALTQDAMLQLWNAQKLQGAAPSAIYTSLGVQRAYFNTLQGQVRFDKPTQLEGGFEALQFNNKPIIADIDAPYGKMYFLDEPNLVVFSDNDWHFLDEDGDVLKWVIGFDAWEAALARYIQFGARRRNTQGLLFGITDTTGL